MLIFYSYVSHYQRVDGIPNLPSAVAVVAFQAPAAMRPWRSLRCIPGWLPQWARGRARWARWARWPRPGGDNAMGPKAFGQKVRTKIAADLTLIYSGNELESLPRQKKTPKLEFEWIKPMIHWKFV